MYLVSRYAPHEAYPCIEPNVRFSRIRLPTKLIIHSCLINIDIYLRSCQWIDLQHIIECLPCVAYFLATPIEPIKETFLNSVPIAVYGSEIVSYAVIVIVPNKYPIQLGYYQSQRPMSDGTDQPMDFLAFLCKLLLTCFPFNPEIPRLAVRAVMSEPQKCKGIWFPFPSAFPVFFSMPAKVQFLAMRFIFVAKNKSNFLCVKSQFFH